MPGYTRMEKRSIAREFLAPKQLSAHGLTDERLDFERDGLERIIDSYTREAGVRGVEREIGAVCRHVAMRVAEGETGAIVIAALLAGCTARRTSSWIRSSSRERICTSTCPREEPPRTGRAPASRCSAPSPRFCSSARSGGMWP